MPDLKHQPPVETSTQKDSYPLILGIIPARFASTRFPGKPLIDIQGKSMIRRVYEQSMQAARLSKVVVATDDIRIFEHVQTFGGEVILTHSEHVSGTDRCQEALTNLGGNYSHVINIQGDEPFIDPSQIDLLADLLNDRDVELATLMIPVDSEEMLFDRGEVKVVFNSNREALFFSRMPIPCLKGIPEKDWHKQHHYFRHVGLYAYRTDVLAKITQLPLSALEKAESLEQLRWLENGFKIKLAITAFDSHCIDSPEDVERALRLMKKK
jgi:3-deoxy-manno-octulosonate cytidylyltransferase (CMP-KDO synthetase)